MMARVFFIVFRKELKDLFRDRKTIIVGVLLPLLMFPMIYGLMGKSMESSTKKVAEEVKIVLVDKSESSLGKLLKSQKNISIIDSADPAKDVQDGKAYVAVIISEEFDKKVEGEKVSEVKILIDDTSQSSQMAGNIVNKLIQAYSNEVVKSRLLARDIDVSILDPVSIIEETVAKEKGGLGMFMLSMILPMFLVIYAVSSPMAAAIDLGAGEKERGTLEPLLTTQASRFDLLFGKLLAITVMGIIGSIASIIGLLISIKIAPGVFGGETTVIIPTPALILIGVAVILLTLTFGALELAISIYARSFKEAQTYLTPLSIVGMAAGFGVYMVDVKNLGIAYFNIPIVNMTLVIKEFINGIYNPLHMGITFGWSLAYIVIALLFVRYMFSREDVIFRT
jgi:sodium transport system permease protein